MSASESVDPLQFARQGRVVSGECPAGSLPRLGEQLARPDGTVRFTLAGHVRADGKPAIRLTVEARVILACHRCLGDLSVPVASSRDLVFVEADRMPSLEDEEAEADYLPADERIEPIAIVEEEVLLALPMVPRHTQCDETDSPAESSGSGFH